MSRVLYPGMKFTYGEMVALSLIQVLDCLVWSAQILITLVLIQHYLSVGPAGGSTGGRLRPKWRI